MNPWYAAKALPIRVSPDIRGGFDIGFDDRIPEEMRAELRRFVVWVEKNFPVPVPLWVDFEYKHYLMSRSKKRMGYLFYHSDFAEWPVFNSLDDMPIIRLPVRTEHSTLEEILFSFIEAITCYFIWLSNGYAQDAHPLPDGDDAEEILQAYLHHNPT